MQTANDRLHDQLASAEGDNTALRADLANLLRTHQELVHSREESKQLQLEANRHIAQLEADVSDLSQQLMVGETRAHGTPDLRASRSQLVTCLPSTNHHDMSW